MEQISQENSTMYDSHYIFKMEETAKIKFAIIFSKCLTPKAVHWPTNRSHGNNEKFHHIYIFFSQEEFLIYNEELLKNVILLPQFKREKREGASKHNEPNYTEIRENQKT